MTLVSLIVPCHDLGRTLEDAVDSVFAQTWREFEILVVDDGSTEPATRRLLAEFDWPRTRVLALPSHCPARALGAGLESAQGDFVAVLDPRHVLEPTYLERALAAFEADEALSLVTCWLPPAWNSREAVPVEGLVLPGLLVSCTVAPAAVARRAAIVDAGGFDAAFASSRDAEWDLWIRMAERGLRSAVIPEPLVRLGHDGTVGDGPWEVDRREENARRLVDKHRETYARHSVDLLAAKEALLQEMVRRNVSRRPQVVVMPPEMAAVGESATRRGRLERVAAPPLPAAAPEATPLAVADPSGRTAALESALAAARGEAEALRNSASWRLTAPLRAVHRWLMRVRGLG